MSFPSSTQGALTPFATLGYVVKLLRSKSLAMQRSLHLNLELLKLETSQFVFLKTTDIPPEYFSPCLRGFFLVRNTALACNAVLGRIFRNPQVAEADVAAGVVSLQDQVAGLQSQAAAGVFVRLAFVLPIGDLVAVDP